MDITGIQALAEAVTNLEKRGVRVIFCEANMRVLKKLMRAGVVTRKRPRMYLGSLKAALADVNTIV
jgi:SulP family sulfate permease